LALGSRRRGTSTCTLSEARLQALIREPDTTIESLHQGASCAVVFSSTVARCASRRRTTLVADA
jgi:hypothetical protein